MPDNKTKEDSEEHRLFAKIESVNKQLTDINSQLDDEGLNALDDVDLSVRLDYVESLYSNFQHTATVFEEEYASGTDLKIRSNFMMIYFEVKAKIKRKINNICNSQLRQHSSTIRQYSLDETMNVRKTRLPELKIPQFSGSYTEWPDFFAMFTTVIANDGELSKIEKFQHLRACLKGAALDTISSLEPSDGNYDKAIELLKTRFDNKLINFQAHIKGIFGLKGVERGSATSLRQLSDKLNAHLRALETMCCKEQICDGFLIYLISSKLDTQLQTKWEESLRTDQLPTLALITKFLEQRCRMLENLENSIVTKVPNQQMSKRSSNHIQNVLVTSQRAMPICNFCSKKDHYITDCTSFMNLLPTIRFNEAKKLNLCLNCLRKGHRLLHCKSGTCRHCAQKHHSLLHLGIRDASMSKTSTLLDNPSRCETKEASQQQLISPIGQSTLVSSLSQNKSPELPSNENNVFLATAIILVKNKIGAFMPCRAIFDSASQLNFISSRFANQLQLKFTKSFTSISGIGDGNFLADKSANVSIKSHHSDYRVSFDAIVIPTITGYQPSTNFHLNQFEIPKNIKLADPEFSKRGRIDVLIGASLFFELMDVGQVRLGKNLPLLQKTRLGWVVSGGGVCMPNSFSLATVQRDSIEPNNETLLEIMKSFWEIENNFKNNSSVKMQDELCEEHFRQNVVRLESGEYTVSLPKKENISQLGDSYGLARRRFLNLERKLGKNPDIKKQYVAFMEEYVNLNHMSLVRNIPENIKINFLPHHCVLKEDSTTTKLRVVFDGSAKTSTSVSLNDTLYVGPTIQPKLFNTLLNFRFFKIALSADICKMYHCVRISNPDNFLQCILWRNCTDERLQTYKLDTVTYGTKPAAFLAIRAMHQLAIDEENAFPIGARIVKSNFYVDDLITGGTTVGEVNEIRQQVTNLLKRGNFHIRKWCSNDKSILDDIPIADREECLKFQDGTDIKKTLGLVWDPDADTFIFSFSQIDDTRIVSKRSILSSIARLYDPLGLIGPVITKAKVFMQTLWKNSLDWDESLPQLLHSAWMQFVSTFSLFHKFIYPRFVSIPGSTIQIHAFCDASLSAYGACIYVRAELDENIKVSLLCSKSRVAPLKVLTVPKLELSAATLLAELLNEIAEIFGNEYEYHCWSDSMVVLSWLRQESSNYNIFVANRISKIQNLTKNMKWHHVPSEHNPADILSRGATPEELLKSKLWMNGPDFLYKKPTNWPEIVNFISDLPERRRAVLIVTPAYDFSINCKFRNSFPKIQRTFAYVSKFLKFKKEIRYVEELSLEDIKMGTHVLFRNIQFIHFATEYKALHGNKDIPSSSKLYSLTPFLDSEGLIRVGGRLQNSLLSFEAKHPIIIPKNHPVTTALILYTHQQLLHAGPQSLLANIRQQYWPLGGRKTVSSIIGKCLKCFRMKPVISQQLMGSLPADRVQPKRPFYTTGIDFCGPFYFKSEIKNRAPLKCYMCIFICFSTKAVHFELVQDLSTASFLSSLKRFISTRGKPNTIWSDNATNFVGAKNELDELRRLFFDQAHLKKLNQQCLEDGIKWKFIPPRSPHFGGLWESAVKSAKHHFYRTVGVSILTFDELRTLMCQISAILNSRPLCPLSENPNDLEVLTPAHFLVGSSLTAIPEPDLRELNFNHLNRWQRVCYMQQIFWKKWTKSYLTSLQERSKWRSTESNLTKGTLVLIKEENTPPLRWQLGRILDLISGSDGVARVAILKTNNNIIRRAIAKLAALPNQSEAVERPMLPTGGGC